MTYRASKKARKLWSEQANAKQARDRLLRSDDSVELLDPDDDEIEIVVRRKLTGEDARFICTRGDRIDNYRVYCNGKYQGVQSITTMTNNIRKALPAFRRME